MQQKILFFLNIIYLKEIKNLWLNLFLIKDLNYSLKKTYFIIFLIFFEIMCCKKQKKAGLLSPPNNHVFQKENLLFSVLLFLLNFIDYT